MQGGDRGDGEQEADEAEERDHDEEGEDDHHGVERGRPAHHHRFYDVPLDGLDNGVSGNDPQGLHRLPARERQKERQEDREHGPEQRDKTEQAREDAQQERERSLYKVERQSTGRRGARRKAPLLRTPDASAFLLL